MGHFTIALFYTYQSAAGVLFAYCTAKNERTENSKKPRAIGITLSLKNRLIMVAIGTATILVNDPIKAAPKPAI